MDVIATQPQRGPPRKATPHSDSWPRVCAVLPHRMPSRCTTSAGVRCRDRLRPFSKVVVLVLSCLCLAPLALAVQRSWLENKRTFDDFPILVECPMYLGVQGSILVYGGVLARNFVDELYLWNPTARRISQIGTGPTGLGLHHKQALAQQSVHWIRWAAVGPKVLMVFLPMNDWREARNASHPWNKLSAYLFDVSVPEAGWLNVADGGASSGSSPPGIHGFGLAGANGKFYIFGGRKHRKSYNDELIMFDPASFTWSVVPTQNAPRVPILMTEANIGKPNAFEPEEDAEISLLSTEFGATHSLEFFEGKLFFTNQSDIWQLDFGTEPPTWSLDERVITNEPPSWFLQGTLLSCGGELLHVTCNGYKKNLDKIVPRPEGEAVTCDWQIPDPELCDTCTKNGNCTHALNRRDNTNPTAACFNGQVFCEGGGAEQGESGALFVPQGIDVATRQVRRFPNEYEPPNTFYAGTAAGPTGAENGVGIGQALTTVLSGSEGELLLVSVDAATATRNMTLYAVDLFTRPAKEARPPEPTVMASIEMAGTPEAFTGIVGVGAAMVACGESGVYRLSRRDVYTYGRTWAGDEETKVAPFAVFFEKQEPPAPQACELLAVVDGKVAVFAAGGLHLGTVEGQQVGWAAAGAIDESEHPKGIFSEYLDLYQEFAFGFYRGITAWTGPFVVQWPMTDERAQAVQLLGRLFDAEKMRWQKMSDPGIFTAELTDGEGDAYIQDIQGYRGKFYFWMYRAQFGLYRIFGKDSVLTYDPVADEWEDITGLSGGIPGTLGDTSGNLEQPLFFFIEADGNLLMLDKQINDDDYYGGGQTQSFVAFDVFTVPIAAEIESTGNLWSDLSSAFDGDTVCIAEGTTLPNTIRFGANAPGSVTILDCAAAAAARRRRGGGGARRIGSYAGARQVELGEEAMLICWETDGCVDVRLESLTLRCGAAQRPTPVQVIGSGAALAMSGVRVQGCWSEGDGGAVLVDNARLAVRDSRFEGLRAAGSGGALYMRGGRAEVANSEFEGCAAGDVGGAIRAVPLETMLLGERGAELRRFAPSLTLSEARVVGNSARAGGALYCTEAAVEVQGGRFEGNNATAETGGAVHLVDSSARLRGAEFAGNQARWGGGALFWQTVEPDLRGEDICAAGGNTAQWGPCRASNAVELWVEAAGREVELKTGVSLGPVGVEVRDAYGQTLTTESEALFEVLAAMNRTYAEDAANTQLTGTLIVTATRGAALFSNINPEIRFRGWDLVAKRAAAITLPGIFFQSTDPYSGQTLRSDIIALQPGEDDEVCEAGSVVEFNDVRTDPDGVASGRGRCVLCGAGSYSLSPLSSPTPGTNRPACFPCPAGADENCLQTFSGNGTESIGSWAQEGDAFRIQTCPPGFIVVRDDAQPDQDQCVECPFETFSRGEAVYEAEGDKVAARVIDATSKCTPCPANAACPGGTLVIPDDGFWSTDAPFTPVPEEKQHLVDDDELQMYKCPPGLCAGANNCTTAGDRVCAVCPPKHARTPGGCLACEGDVGAMKGVAGFFGALVFLILWYWFAWRPMLQDVSVFAMVEQGVQHALSCWFKAKDAQADGEGKIGQVMGCFSIASSIWDKLKGDFQGFMKIIISFYQVVSSFGSTFTVDWPKDLLNLFDGAKFFQLDFISLPGPACLTFDWSYADKLTVYTVVPIVVVLLIGIPVSVAYSLARKTGALSDYPKWDPTVSLFWYSLLFFLYIIYPMVSVQVLTTFSCQRLGPAGNWLVADYRVWCPTDYPGDFLFGWSIFFTLVYPAGIPLFFAGVMLYFRIPAMARIKLDAERLQKTIDLYRRETGSVEGQSLLRHVDTVAAQHGAEGDLVVGIRRMFDIIDDDGNGFLTVQELREHMVREGMCTEGDFKRAVPLRKALRGMAKGGKMTFEQFVDLVNQLDRTYNSFTGRDIPSNLSLEDDPISRLSRQQLELLANHPWDFSEEGEIDASSETLLRNMAEGGDGRRASMEEDLASFEEEEEEEEPKEEEAPLRRSELEEKVQGIVGELESLGKIDMPALGWEGTLEGEQEALDRIGFLFTMYEVKYWYFELVEMVRKLLVTAVLVFVFPRTPAQLAAGLVISFGSLILYYSCRPFLSQRLDALQIFALITQCVNLFYGIMLIVQRATAGTSGSNQEDALITGIVVLLNVIIVAVPFINMASERGLSVSSAMAWLSCCSKPKPTRGADEEEGLEGEQHRYGRCSSTYSAENNTVQRLRSQENAAKIRQFDAANPADGDNGGGALAGDNNGGGALPAGEPRGGGEAAGGGGGPEGGGGEPPVIEFSNRPDDGAAGPSEIEVTLAEPRRSREMMEEDREDDDDDDDDGRGEPRRA